MPASLFSSSTSLGLFVSGEYRVSVFHFKLLDLALLLAIQVILVLWGTPDSLAGGLAQLACIFALLAGMLALLLVVRPHRHEDRWNLVVEVYILLLAGLQASVDFVNVLARRAEAAVAAPSGSSASTKGGSGTSDGSGGASSVNSLRATVVVLAYCCLVASMGLFVVILFAFVASLWAAAEEAAATRVAQRLLAPRGARTRAFPTGGALVGRRAAALQSTQ
jgi:hypothetical protein